MVFLCLGLSVFSTIEDHEYEDLAETSLFYLEVVVVVWFGIEFIVRLWSSGCRSRYQGWIGRLRFMKSHFCIIGVVLTLCDDTCFQNVFPTTYRISYRIIVLEITFKKSIRCILHFCKALRNLLFLRKAFYGFKSKKLLLIVFFQNFLKKYIFVVAANCNSNTLTYLQNRTTGNKVLIIIVNYNFRNQLINYRCDNCGGFPHCLKWLWQTNGCSFGIERSSILPDIANGSNGSKRWYLEVTGVSCVCSSSSK